MAYIFIYDRLYAEKGEDKKYLAIDPDEIEKMKISDTYDKYGRKVDTDTSGDSVCLLSQKAIDVANRVAKEQESSDRFEVNDMIYAYNHADIYDEVFKELVKLDDKDWEDYSPTCEGFNYWDGSNWKTVMVSTEVGDPDYTLVDDRELEKRLNKAIETGEITNQGFGYIIYESGDYQIEENFYQGHFESFSIVEK